MSMRKVLLVFVLGLMCVQGVWAQKRDTMIYYMKYDDSMVPEKKDADFIRMIMPPDSADATLYPVYEYYLNGRQKLIAASRLKNGALNFEGTHMSFYPSGRRQRVATYKDGDLTGEMSIYYPSGKLYTVTAKGKNGNIRLIQCRDTSGAVLAKDGIGNWLKYDEKFEEIIAKGPVVNGMENGEWGEIAENDIDCTCIYKNGKLVSGVAFKDGKTYPFKQKETPPFFKGGSEAFVSTLFHYIKYKNPVKDVMTVRFIVETDGKITDPHIVRGLNPDLDAETLKALQSLPPWQPGL